MYFNFYFTSIIIYWYDIRTCIDCYDFSKIMLHEIGHTFGLNHSNTNEYSIMKSLYNHEINTCIYPEDFNMYNKLYNTSFNRTICNILKDSDTFFLQNTLFVFFIFLLFYILSLFLYNKLSNFFKKRRVINTPENIVQYL